MMLLGIYRPLAATGEGCYVQLEEELNSLCTWASMLKNFVLVTGDLDRLRPDKKEGKILLDVEEVHNFGMSYTQTNKSYREILNFDRCYVNK